MGYAVRVGHIQTIKTERVRTESVRTLSGGMELVKIAPRRNTVFEVGSHRRGDKIVGDVHGDLAEVFAHAFEHKAHHAGIEVDVGRMVKEIEGACAV